MNASLPTAADTVTLELIKGAIRSARGEMEALIDRTAMSPFIREKKDFFTAFFDRDAPVEIVNLRVRATGLMDKIALPTIEAVEPGTPARPWSHRQVSFDGRGFVETPTFRRTDLRAGHALGGPAIVDQVDTTTVIFPGQTARVDDWGNLIVTLGG